MSGEPGATRRIRRSAQVPGDMWAWFAFELVAVVFVVFAAGWPVTVRAGVLPIPIALLATRLLGRRRDD